MFVSPQILFVSMMPKLVQILNHFENSNHSQLFNPEYFFRIFIQRDSGQ